MFLSGSGEEQIVDVSTGRISNKMYLTHALWVAVDVVYVVCRSYILSLSRLAQLDYSHDQSRLSFAECVDLCTDTIQAEGRAKRRH